MRIFSNLPIRLKCLGCGREMDYARGADLSIPPQVVTMEHNHCDKCDTGGGFGTETWYDADGNEVVPEAAFID